MRQQSTPLTINGVKVAGSANLSTTFTTDAINLFSIYAFSIQVNWSSGAAPSGTFNLQGSNDPGDAGSGQAVTKPTNFTNITNSSQAISGTPGSILFDVTECSYRWVRLVYTATSGSANVTNAQMNAKGV